ncbi:molybdenum ABC transporter, periplasmic molybdate-binding protein [Magnetococcus marinus MC-1]|uniref:Molybdenum ABC transporter, periplasmic molybdate-binding protein n=1 Tax=Magnetococcus marinus (strain ATCC BAA-1437 / JCM 17883 / MC-1) TaxID=156889 RepID=A0LCY5_MAGMM|nr:substrate-binding domain-containing protein [Magnetococcus marinus]ABK45828.1 molybdenum ABC transporter, periplasmic molybdate-binding protein [Magnetococcus marinus MC-1]
MGMTRRRFSALALCTPLLLWGCGESSDKQAAATPPPTPTDEQATLLIYCGITMIKPIMAIGKLLEQREPVKMVYTQGGSQDLYLSLKKSHEGDLYLPGSASYLERNMADGLLGNTVHVGYNQAAFMVKKGNPLKVKGDIKELLREDLSVVICNPESGSIGRETKKILTDAGIYQQIFERATYLTTASRTLNAALKKGDADLILNWRATGYFEENKALFDVVDLPASMAIPKKLVLSKLTFSRHPQLAEKFMQLAASEEGQQIFRDYGFLDNKADIR